MNKITTLLFMLLISLTVSAQSDFDIAKEFMSKKGVTLKNNPSKTRGENKPYSIFNGENDKGFAIVVNGNVVGYDTENTVDEDNMPCGFKEFIKGYSETTNASRTRSDDSVEPIAPLIKTKWGQCHPYNDLLVKKKTGICTLVAWCQLLHYYKVPQTFKEKVVNDTLTLPLYYFDHDKMPDEYHGSGGLTSEEIAERKEICYSVAILFYYFEQIDVKGFEEYFGVKEEEIRGNDNNLWTAYDEYLEKGMPFMVCGGYENVGHAFIIDGRDENHNYHINWGWEGYCDGYYNVPKKKEERFAYEGDDRNKLFASSVISGFTIIPKLFSWSYTTDIYKPNFDVAKASNTDVYNLQGVKVGNSLEGLPKGVYIQGGKKYMVK